VCKSKHGVLVVVGVKTLRMVLVVGVALDIKNVGLLCQVWAQPKQSQLAQGGLPAPQVALAMLAVVQLSELWLLPTGVVVVVQVFQIMFSVEVVLVCLAPV